MPGRVFWKNPNPTKKKNRKKMTAPEKREAARRASAEGRRYPNLVDNSAVIRKRNK
mgnify:FL=1|tara:strand:+ start:430 stop:597 length:168 start_codon:yes stop_codon:yes gene_type:complete